MKKEAQAILKKAEVCIVSANTLLESGDTDGAINRAYHAMLNAARAALLSLQSPVDTSEHSSVIKAFAAHLIKTGLASKEMGRHFNQALEMSNQADYKPTKMAVDKAQKLVAHAGLFVSSVVNGLSAIMAYTNEDPRLRQITMEFAE